MDLDEQLSTVPEVAKSPIIVLTGGGSGGHITPLLAVAEELKKQRPDCRLVFIGQKGDKLLDVPRKHSSIEAVYSVRAGKLRRYHGEGLKQLFDLKTMLKNVRDLFYTLVGIYQSYKLLSKISPQVIFVKGGYVGVPVGLAAALRHIPFITHDSDAMPGLANRIISKWAAAHAVALPKDIYRYPSDKTFTVGVPISRQFQSVDSHAQAIYKRQIGLKTTNQVLLITGGGNGAQPLNEALTNLSPQLLQTKPNLVIIHVTGHKNFDNVQTRYNELLKSDNLLSRVIIKDFVASDLYIYSGAADIIITRAGATTLAEFATQHKCCIVVPNPMLTGGHQLKNAKYLADQKAAIIVDNDQLGEPEQLYKPILDLLDDPGLRTRLGKQLGQFAKPRATKELAELLLDVIT